MATIFTSDKISLTSTDFFIHARRYDYGRSNTFIGFPYRKVLEVYNTPNINLYGEGSIGYDGRGFAGSTGTHTTGLDDDTPVIDYFIAGSTPNNSITIYSFLSAYFYNFNTNAIDLSRITGGIYRGGARWNSSGVITVTGLQRVGGYSGSNWSSPGTSDAAGNAFAFIAIGNDLYLRQRKAPITHSNHSTYSNIIFFGTSTLERFAFNYPALSSAGCGQGYF